AQFHRRQRAAENGNWEDPEVRAARASAGDLQPVGDPPDRASAGTPAVSRNQTKGSAYEAQAFWRGGRGVWPGPVKRKDPGEVVRPECAVGSIAVGNRRIHGGVGRRRMAEAQRVAELVRRDVLDIKPVRAPRGAS